MGNPYSKTSVQFSLLDRLINEDPELSVEQPKNTPQQLREFQRNVQRDLENLLNTRRRGMGWPNMMEELSQSLVSYGMPDFGADGFATSDSRKELKRTMQQVIEQGEPRFKSVKVSLLENLDVGDRTVRFRIDAMLDVEPSPEPVTFDSTLEPISCSFAVKG